MNNCLLCSPGSPGSSMLKSPGSTLPPPGMPVSSSSSGVQLRSNSMDGGVGVAAAGVEVLLLLPTQSPQLLLHKRLCSAVNWHKMLLLLCSTQKLLMLCSAVLFQSVLLHTQKLLLLCCAVIANCCYWLLLQDINCYYDELLLWQTVATVMRGFCRALNCCCVLLTLTAATLLPWIWFDLLEYFPGLLLALLPWIWFSVMNCCCLLAVFDL